MAFERGKPIPARTLNQMGNQAREGANVSGVGVEVQQGPGGNAISIPTPQVVIENAVQAEFTTAGTVLLFGVVEVYEGWETSVAFGTGKCRIPSQSGFGRIGAVLSGATNGGTINVQIKGVGYVLFDYDSVPVSYQTRTRYRLGGKKNSHLAQYDMLGPFVLIKDLGIVVGYPHHVALVEFTGRRGDNKMADCGSGSYEDVSAPYRTYVWDSSYAIHEDSPGNINISLAP